MQETNKLQIKIAQETIAIIIKNHIYLKINYARYHGQHKSSCCRMMKMGVQMNRKILKHTKLKYKKLRKSAQTYETQSTTLRFIGTSLGQQNFGKTNVRQIKSKEQTNSSSTYKIILK